MKGPARSGSIAALLFALAACASAPNRASAPPPAAVPAPALALAPAPAPDAADTAAPLAKEHADAAARRFEGRLDELERLCGSEWKDDHVCDGEGFADLAAAYEAYYATHDDPHAGEGRIDALARLGGRGVTGEILAIRLGLACENRCGGARRASMDVARSAAIEACVRHDGIRACTALGELPHVDAAAKKRAAEDCRDACDERLRIRRAAEEEERRRPRTAQEAASCLRACVFHCNGGRPPSPDDWCGTCQVSCEAHCAIRTKP